MSIWESIGSTYADAVTSAVPLHRLLLFGCGFVGALSVRSQTHLSIVESIANLGIVEFLSLKNGLIGIATLGDILVGTVVSIAGWGVARAFLWLVFALAARSTKFWERVESATTDLGEQVMQAIEQRQTAIGLLDSMLQQPRSRLRKLNALAEQCFGGSCGLAVAFHWGNVLDLLVAMALFMAGLALHVTTVRLFVAEYFGPALLKAQLQGKKPPTLMDMGWFQH